MEDSKDVTFWNMINKNIETALQSSCSEAREVLRECMCCSGTFNPLQLQVRRWSRRSQ